MTSWTRRPAKERDPRTSSRYRRTRAAWLPHHHGERCPLCGRSVDATLPAQYALGPTIEHTVPIRTLRLMASTWDELVALTCDTSAWAIAHTECQRKQGARAGYAAQQRAMGVGRRASRDW